MKRLNPGARALSVCAFSLLFAYVLSFLFEGRVLYVLLHEHGIDASGYVLAAIVAHFFGLFSCGFFCKTLHQAKRVVLCGMGVCFLSAIPFFFAPSILWTLALMLGGYAAGCAVAAWGYYLREFTPKNRRLQACADMLIYSNLLMIGINAAAVYVSPLIGLGLCLLCLPLGMALASRPHPALKRPPPRTKQGRRLAYESPWLCCSCSSP